jgi:hypothetical protein
MSGLEAIVGLVALGIAVPTVVETFLHAGRYLFEKSRAGNGNVETERVQRFAGSLEHGTMRLSLELAEDLFCDTSDTSLRESISRFIEHLRCNILRLDKALDEMAKGHNERSRKKGSKEVLAFVDTLEKTEKDFQEFLNVKFGSKFVPSKLELRSNQFQIIGPSNQSPTKLPHSDATIIQVDFSGADNRWGNAQKCIVEEKTYPGHKYEAAYQRAKDLGRLLEFTRASEGLLEFAGFHVLSSSPFVSDRFQLIFAFPNNAAYPRSLRDIFLDPVNLPRPPIPRNFRFILPRKLAEAVYHVHRHNLVHKSIRPETILIFESKLEDGSRGPSYPATIGDPYLTDWQLSRKTAESSNRALAPGDWTVALYQHPKRQLGAGLVAESKYNIGHDIYSLGVCLLEIGLWTSFLTYNGNSPFLSSMFREQKDIWKTQHANRLATLSDAEIEQQTFIMLAGDILAYEMGETYSKMVLKCLSCLEKGFGNVVTFVNSDSKEWEDEGVAFIQEVRRELNCASMMGSGIYNRV